MSEPLPHDAATALDSLEAVAAFLADAFDSGNGERVAAALAAVARSDGLAELAAAASLPREQLKASFERGEIGFEATLAIMKVVDLHAG